jgi:hypothetical protein
VRVLLVVLLLTAPAFGQAGPALPRAILTAPLDLGCPQTGEGAQEIAGRGSSREGRRRPLPMGEAEAGAPVARKERRGPSSDRRPRTAEVPLAAWGFPSLAPPSVPIAEPPFTHSPARPVPSPIAAPVQPSRELFATSASTRGEFDREFWLWSALYGASATGDLVTTWDAVRRCPACQEGNVLLREERTTRPHFGKIAAAKVGLWGVSAVLRRRAPRLSKYLLISGTAWGAVGISINVTVGK